MHLPLMITSGSSAPPPARSAPDAITFVGSGGSTVAEEGERCSVWLLCSVLTRTHKERRCRYAYGDRGPGDVQTNVEFRVSVFSKKKAACCPVLHLSPFSFFSWPLVFANFFVCILRLDKIIMTSELLTSFDSWSTQLSLTRLISILPRAELIS